MPQAQQSSAASWRAQLFRATAYTTKNYGVEASKWWDNVVGEPPESKTEKLKESILSLEGPCGPYRLLLNCTLHRIDWILAGELKLDQEMPEIPNLGDYTVVLKFFSDRLSPWFNSAPPVLRLAFGPVLVIPVDDKVSGYKAIQRYLPSLKLDAEASSDLLYQINRPRQSNVVTDLTINRLQKWSVARLQRFAMSAEVGLQLQLLQAATYEPAFNGCRLELDINTSADVTEPLPAKSVRPLYEELVHLATEITDRGDIA